MLLKLTLAVDEKYFTDCRSVTRLPGVRARCKGDCGCLLQCNRKKYLQYPGCTASLIKCARFILRGTIAMAGAGVQSAA